MLLRITNYLNLSDRLNPIQNNFDRKFANNDNTHNGNIISMQCIFLT